MKIFVPDPMELKRIRFCNEHDIGLLYVPKLNRIPRSKLFIVDNGAYEAWNKGVFWDDEKFLKYCERLNKEGHIPYFVVLPDVVAGGVNSLEQSAKYFHTIPQKWQKYLAVQDGMTHQDVIGFLCYHDCAGVFVGGTKEWKYRTLSGWVKFAHERGLLCHVGRVGTKRAYDVCEQAGVDSVDGSTPVRHQKLHIITEWRRENKQQVRFIDPEVDHRWRNAAAGICGDD
jgi:hypothetical protein